MRTSIITIFLLFFCQLSVGQKDYEMVLMEGFYSKGWEQSFFYEKKNDAIKKPIWLEFDSSFVFNDSLSKIFNGEDAVFLKVYGRKQTGGNFGHMGSCESKLTITEIVFIDPKQTLINYFQSKRKKATLK